MNLICRNSEKATSSGKEKKKLFSKKRKWQLNQIKLNVDICDTFSFRMKSQNHLFCILAEIGMKCSLVMEHTHTLAPVDGGATIRKIKRFSKSCNVYVNANSVSGPYCLPSHRDKKSDSQ